MNLSKFLVKTMAEVNRNFQSEIVSTPWIGVPVAFLLLPQLQLIVRGILFLSHIVGNSVLQPKKIAIFA